MTQRYLGSAGRILFPEWPAFGASNGISNLGVIDATGEKVALIGRVVSKDRSSKSITKVGVRFGAVTKAGGSGLTLSLQDVSLIANPLQPDEVQDQIVAIAAADVTANTWLQSNALSASRAVAHGDLLAVVLEFDGGGRLGADSYALSGLIELESMLQCDVVLKTVSWASQTRIPSVILEFTDGTFGTLDGAIPFSAYNTHNYHSGSTPDEYAQNFQLPFPATIEGAWVVVSLGAVSSDFEVVLYEGTTALATATIDAHASVVVASGRRLFVTFATPYAAAKNTTYRLGFKPTTVNAISIFSVDIANADHRQAFGGGTTWSHTTRTDAGAWAAETTTRRIICGLSLNAFDDAVSTNASGTIFSSPIIL